MTALTLDVVEQRVRSGEDLTRLDLRRANLSGARLAGAKLARAELDGANLDGADLSGAELRGASLREVFATRLLNQAVALCAHDRCDEAEVLLRRLLSRRKLPQLAVFVALRPGAHRHQQRMQQNRRAGCENPGHLIRDRQPAPRVRAR